MKRIIGLMLILVLTLTSCTTTPKESSVPSTDSPSPQEMSDTTPEMSEASIPEISFDDLVYEDFLKDYDTFWKTLEGNYPFLGVAKRSGVDIDSLKTSGREKINENTTLDEFNVIMKETADGLMGIGHMEYIGTPDSYMGYLNLYMPEEGHEGYPDASHTDYLYKVLMGNRTQAVYTYLSDNKDSASVQDDADYVTERYSTEILKEGEIALVKMPSFQYEYLWEDLGELEAFYKSIEDYPNLIIDIRGNTGGADVYWISGIVQPLIKEALSYDLVLLFNDTDLIRQYLRAGKFYEFKKPLEAAGELPELKSEDREALTNAWIVQDKIFPSNPDNKFDGKIWLLVDEAVYSSAESFTMVAKKTGFATIVGSQTDGDGAGIDPMMFSLPNTGLVWRNSIFYSINPDGSNNEELGTTPDIVVSSGSDALEICLTEISK